MTSTKQKTSSRKSSGLVGSSNTKLNKKQLGGIIVALIVVGVGIKLVSNASTSTCVQGTFRQGNSGQCVRDIQALLNFAPYGPKLTVDGRYGPTTKSAVLRYQKPMGLVADGVVGPKTWSYICSPQMGPGVPLSWPRAAAHDAGCVGW